MGTQADIDKAIMFTELDCFEIEDMISYLKIFGYEVTKQDQAETIETDIRGAEIKANGQTYKFGMVKIIVGAG